MTESFVEAVSTSAETASIFVSGFSSPEPDPAHAATI